MAGDGGNGLKREEVGEQRECPRRRRPALGGPPAEPPTEPALPAVDDGTALPTGEGGAGIDGHAGVPTVSRPAEDR